MKILSLFVAVPILMAAPVFAVLPPLYATLAEFQSLVNSKELAAKLDSGEALVAISRTSNGFTVETNKHTLDVEVVYEPIGRPGPAKFHLVFKDPQPIGG